MYIIFESQNVSSFTKTNQFTESLNAEIREMKCIELKGLWD